MRPWARRFVLAVVFGVAAFDISAGLLLLTVDEPWILSGYAASWHALAEPMRADRGVRALLTAPARRLGALSLHIGVVTMAWAIMARNDRRLLTMLLVVYTLTGTIVFAADLASTRGTGYMVLKQIIGALWAIALVVHFAAGRRA